MLGGISLVAGTEGLLGAKRFTAPWWLATKDERAIFYAGVSVLFSVVLVVVKLSLFLLEPSFFLIANVLFTTGVAIAKTVAVGAYRRAISPAEAAAVPVGHQYRATLVIGVVLAVSAVAYMGLCLPLLLGDEVSMAFDPLVAEILALIAFVEIGTAITGVVRTRHARRPIVKAIRVVNLGSSSVMLVLAQAAILSFTSTESWSWGVGMSAMLFGGAALLGGLYLVFGSILRTRLLGVRPKGDANVQLTATRGMRRVPRWMESTRPGNHDTTQAARLPARQPSEVTRSG